jgi:hypothetical protein
MKAKQRYPVLFLTILSILIGTCWVHAASMVIRFQDGRTVVHDTNRISSITFDGISHHPQPPVSVPSAENYLLNEEFANGLSTLWEPIQVVGGNYERFAALAPGKLAVNVPAGNSWGKTGIMSRSPLFSVDAGMTANPLKISFDFDPNQTTGYVIALAQAKDADVWRVQNYWLHWLRPTMISGKLYAANTQNAGDKVAEAVTPSQAPNTVALAIRPGSVEAITSQGTRLAMNLGWMKQGVPVYLYIFSHPANQHEAASFALKSIRISQ